MIRKRKPNRLKDFDYSQENLYFITSCVHNRMCCLGVIDDGNMIPNDYGKIAENQWHWLAEQYPYVALHAFVVMPNHIHGIIEIVGTGRHISHSDGNHIVRTGRDLSLRESKIKSLSELMGAYKTTVSKQIHLTGYYEFQWQRSFYDHIIRNYDSFQKISDYIVTNPMKWENDKFFSNVK